MTVLRESGSPEIGKRRFKLGVACEELMGRSHQRVVYIVADTGQRAKTDRLSLAPLLRNRTADILIIRMRRQQSHCRPGFEGWPRFVSPAFDVSFVGVVVIE